MLKVHTLADPIGSPHSDVNREFVGLIGRLT
jgi:hypothetical protein